MSDPSEPRAPVNPLANSANVEGSPGLPAASLAAAATATTDAAGVVAASEDGYGEIWRLAWPVMLSQVLVSGVGLVDIAMVGRLGADAVAAVGYASQFFFLAISVLFAVGFAAIALMARAIGAGDVPRARAALAASLEVAVATAAVVAVAVLAAPELLLRALGANESVIAKTVPFLTLLMGSSVLLAISMTIENGFRAAKDTRTPMLVAFVVTVVKLGGNALLIFGALGFPRLELVGAGIATAISQLVGLGLILLLVARARSDSAIALRPRDFGQAARLRGEVVRLAIPGVAERLAMNLALLAYFRVLSGYGTVPIAAYTVGVRILSFTWIPGTGFGAAASTLVGQALGAGSVGAATRAGWRSTRLAVGVAVVLAAACVGFLDELARLFTTDAETLATLVPFLLCLALAQPFLQAHFALGGAHRGAGDTFTPFVAAAVGNWLLRVPLAFLFAVVFEMEVVWVWYALVFDHIARTAWLASSFRRGRWHDKLEA